MIPFLNPSMRLFGSLVFLFVITYNTSAQTIIAPTDVDSSPYISTCANADKDMQELCSDKSLLNYIYGNMKYSTTAIQNKKEGIVVLKFIVNNKGQIEKEQVARSSGSSLLDASALALITSMKANSSLWQPALKDGKAVSTFIQLPVRFKLK